jgi:hypothetical protein
MPIPAGPDVTNNAAELAAMRLQTRAFIAADEDEVVLTRHSRIPNGSGGYVLTAQPALPSQPGRLIPLQPGGPERHTLDGKLVDPGYHLLMDWGADMQRGDRFVVHGRRYEVVFVTENQSYEVKGEVVYNGDA